MQLRGPSAQTHRVMAYSALWSAILVALWLLARWILMADRGLGLGDEALYLMEAGAPQPDAAYMFPAGWHTGPLFRLVDGDVSAFRTSGAVLLGLAGVWVGLSTARLITAARGRVDSLLNFAAGLTGLSASWMYYFTLLRAPGYNWVNLVGIAIVIGAALRQWARILDRPEANGRWSSTALWATIGFGVIFSLAAKPSTPIFIGLAYTAAALTVVGVKRGIQAFIWIVITSVAWIPILIIFGWWELDFVQVFWDATQRPSMTAGQTPGRAIVNFVSIPALAYTDFRGVTVIPVAIAGGALLALLSNVAYPWRRPALLLVPFAVVLGVSPFFAVSELQIWQQGWERGNITVAFLLVVFAALLLGLGKWPGLQPVGRIQLLVATGGLITLSAAFGFGSANTPYPMMKFAAVPLAAAALLPLSRLPSLPLRRTISVVLAVSLTTTTAHLLLLSQEAPYSSSALHRQTEPVTVGMRDSAILVDEGKADALNQIRQAVKDGGGTDVHLIPIGPNTPGLAFGSGATFPKSIVLGWFGQPGAVALAQANLSRLDSPEWCDAWVLTSPVPDETDVIASLFAESTGRQWPGDYRLEVQVDNFNLWSPKMGCGPTTTYGG